MKTIGLVGGMSWQSTLTYYRLINEGVQQRLGGHHSARILLDSIDFADVVTIATKSDSQRVSGILLNSAQRLQAAGADFLLICSNTIHRFANELAASISIPLLHIADVTAAAVLARGMSSVALLGTRFTMNRAFYRKRLERHGLTVLLPDPEQRIELHRIIFDELVLGRFLEPSRQTFYRTIESLQQAGASGVILGCTEIPLLIEQSQSRLPLFDTTQIHANAAIELALE